MSVWCDRTVTGGILFLILFTPFAFGSVHPWAFAIMEALIFLLVVVWMVKLTLVRVQGVGVGSHFEIRNSKFEISPLALALPLTFHASRLFALIERRLDDVCRNRLVTNFDQDRTARLRKSYRHIAQSDTLLEKR